MQKTFFKTFTSIHVFFYRLSRGRFGSQVRGLPVLLLTITGRKSGKQRTTPLGYIKDTDKYVITASNAGFDFHPDWYHNLVANPQVSIQVEDKLLPATSRIADGDERSRLWKELVQVAPGYSDYERKTTRQIPIIILKTE